MPEKWLITGAQGFIGRYLADHIARAEPLSLIAGFGRSCRRESHFSHCISAPAGRALAPLPAELQRSAAQLCYYSLDITDLSALECLLRRLRPARIVHLASGLRGDRRADLLHINVEGTATLFEAIARIDGYAPRVVLGSSGGVYGNTNPARLPLHENDCCEPLDEYSVTKYSAELLARSAGAHYGIPLIVARIFNVLGPGQDERHVAGRIACELMKAQCDGGAPVELGGLSTTRDFIDVRDTACALYTLAVCGAADGIYNLASGRECPVSQVWEEFRSVAAAPVPVKQNEDRNPGVTRHYAAIERLLSTGYQPAYELAQSVADIWSYYRQIWLN